MMGRAVVGREPAWFKKWARRKVQTALRQGRLVRPDKCEYCGEGGRKIHAHHEDYRKPMEVEWLCTRCHGTRHSATVQMVRGAMGIFDLMCGGRADG